MSARDQHTATKGILRRELLRKWEEAGKPSYDDFAASLGESKASVYKWMQEDTDPQASTLLRLLEKLGWDIDKARPGRKEGPRAAAQEAKPNLSPPRASLAILESIVIGAGRIYEPGRSHATATIDLPCPPYNPRHHYHLVTVADDSMRPTILSGDRLIVDASTRDPVQCLNRIIVANLDETRGQGQGATVSVLGRTSEGLALRPTNPRHRPVFGLAHSQIVGLVVGIIPHGMWPSDINLARTLPLSPQSNPSRAHARGIGNNEG